MAKHDTSGDGHKKDVDVSKIKPPKDTDGKHTDKGDGGKGGGKK